MTPILPIELYFYKFFINMFIVLTGNSVKILGLNSISNAVVMDAN